MRLDLTLAQLNAVRLNLADQFDEDERGYLDLLEGETDAFEMVRKLLNGIEQDAGDIASLKTQIDDRKARQARCEARIEARREALTAIMECAGVDKLPLPEATLSLRKLAPKAVVIDPDKLPDEFCTFKRVPNLTAIRDAEALPEGAALDNGGMSLTIRRK